MNGAGNAILVLDLRGAGFLPAPEDARALAQAPGLGYDQLMVLSDPQAPGQDAFMTIYNQDGSLSASCGNGTRCVAHYLAALSGGENFSSPLPPAPSWRAAKGRCPIRSIWGRPGSAGATFRSPMRSRMSARSNSENSACRRPPASAWAIPTPFSSSPPSRLSISPRSARSLEHDPLFPQRANISLAQVFSRDAIRLKVWERGTGLTLACGTAACATLVAAARAGLERKARDHFAAGRRSRRRMARRDDHIILTGPVEVEFSRRLDADIFAPVVAS